MILSVHAGLSTRGSLLFTTEAEARTFQLSDLPLVHRLQSRGISLDSETYLARGLHTISDAALSRLPLTDLGTPTVVARYGNARVFGQFRHPPGDSHAHIVFIAPALTNGTSDTLEGAWFHLLDALAVAAARSGAQTIQAEVADNSVVFETLRQAGYASYAQQDIWRRDPQPPPAYNRAVVPHRATEQDMPAIRYLHARAVPRLAQQADPAPPPDGLVTYQDGQACSYLAISEGNRGIYLRPYLHPQTSACAQTGNRAQDVLSAALNVLSHTARVPVYCCVRQYQSWLGSALQDLGFSPWARQTVMVKHTAAHVKHPAFAPLPAVKGGITIPGGPTASIQWKTRETTDDHRPYQEIIQAS